VRKAVNLAHSRRRKCGDEDHIQLNDSGAGIDIIYYNNTLNQYNNGSTFGSTRIASGLSYTAVHSLETVTYFKDGYNNDVVNVFLNGTLIYTSGTWEVYYYFLGGVNVQRDYRLSTHYWCDPLGRRSQVTTVTLP
jgi:Tfp pilus assembly protein FimT